MAKGKIPESTEFKASFEGYCSLTEEEQVMFRSKIFSKICCGLTKTQRDEVKAERKGLLDKITSLKKVSSQLQAVSSLSIEALESILEEKKKNMM